MFPLNSKIFPSNASDLQRLLNESINRLFSTSAPPVSVREKTYPSIAELRVNLDAAKLRDNPPRRPAPEGSVSPALTLDALHVSGTGVNVGPATLDLKLTARDVALSQSRDANNEIVLVLQSAAHGEIEISAAKEIIERAIETVAKLEAAKHGVAIDQVQLTVRPRGTRSLDAEVQLRARKLFFTTVIQISAKLDLDAQLNATLSDVRCTSEGTIGSLACGFLAPHLQKVDGRSIALMTLALGDIRLRDVRIAANERLSVNAEFGA